jgi:hypothetical protein
MSLANASGAEGGATMRRHLRRVNDGPWEEVPRMVTPWVDVPWLWAMVCQAALSALGEGLLRRPEWEECWR